MPRKATLGLTFAQFLINCKQANQRWFPLRNNGFHITGIMVSYSKNIHLCTGQVMDFTPDYSSILQEGKRVVDKNV